MSSTIGPAALKRASNMAHARARAAERYALDLTNADLESIAARIQAGSEDVAFLRRDREIKARLWVAVRRDGVWLPFCYDEATRSVLTALPEHAIDGYRSYLASLDGGTPLISVARPPTRTDAPPGTLIRCFEVDGLPEPYQGPEVPPRTCAEATERQLFLRPELAAINRTLTDEAGRKSMKWVLIRARLEANRDAIKAEKARLQRMIEDTNGAFHNATEVDPARADDPQHLLAVALTTIRALAQQLGRPPGPHYAASDAIRDYLRTHAPLIDLAEDRP